MKLFFVACLVAVCSANPPTPKVAESFCGDGEIEFHQSEKTDIGKCKRERYSCLINSMYS